MSPAAAETRTIAAMEEEDRKLRAFLEAEVLAVWPASFQSSWRHLS